MWVRDYLGATKWVPGTITSKVSSVLYEVSVGVRAGADVRWKRHFDQLRKRRSPQEVEQVSNHKDVGEQQSITKRHFTFNGETSTQSRQSPPTQPLADGPRQESDGRTGADAEIERSEADTEHESQDLPQGRSRGPEVPCSAEMGIQPRHVGTPLRRSLRSVGAPRRLIEEI